MNYEIIGAISEPDEKGMLRVDYRTADGKESWIRYTPGCGTPDQVVQDTLAEAARRKAAPPRSFEMVVKMDVSDKSFEELKQEYRDFCKSKGYEVDEKMRAYKPGAACAPRQTA